MEKKNESPSKGVIRIIGIILGCITFAFISYIFACFIISFRHEIISVVIMTLNMCIIAIFSENFDAKYGKKKSFAMVVLSFLLLAVMIYKIGYLEVSNVFTRF